ncbi:MAG TPA: hypothetical protein PLC53_00010 [Bacilli bacterium]|nr:hypothetical protein [Bacilli bacterium]
MIETKIIRVLDSMTDMGVMATKIDNRSNMRNSSILSKCGFWADQESPIILLTFLADNPYETSYDPYTFNDRTRKISGLYIERNFDNLNDGDTIDVREIIKNKLI